MEILAFGLINALIVGPVMAVVMYLLRRSERRETWAREDRLYAQGEQIHTLVNSNLSAAIRGELAALRSEAVAMRALPNAANGKLAAVETRIAELEATMVDRDRQTALGEAQVAAGST